MATLQTWTSDDLRDAVVASYNGLVAPGDIGRNFHGVPRRRVTELVKMIPPGLENTPERLTLQRAANAVCEVVVNDCTTEFEKREGLYKFATRALNKDAVAREYGIKRSTLMAYAKKAKNGAEDWPERARDIRKLVDAVVFDKAGRKPLLTETEELMFVESLGQSETSGFGRNRKAFGAAGRLLCASLSKTEGLGDAEKQRLANAACSRHWVAAVKQRHGGTDSSGSFVTQAKLCPRRAEAMNPALNEAMFAAKKSVYDRLREADVLRTPMPLSKQLFTGDEVGTDPTGKWLPVWRLARNGGLSNVSYRVADGEKAPFWVTVWFWTRADGQMPIPPFVCHQGASISQLMAMGLDPDVCLHATPSGYMDRDGFFKLVKHFLAYCGALRPLFVDFDGHDSHFDADALQLLVDDGIHPFFLKSQDSARDQLNDNGPNAAWQSDYSDAYEEWRLRNPNVPLNVAYFNEIFQKAYNIFQSRSAPIIIAAAKKVGLFPFDPNAENFQGPSRIGEVTGSVAISADGGDGGDGDGADDDGADGSATHTIDGVDVVVEPLPSQQGPECVMLRANVMSPNGSVEARALVRQGAFNFFTKSFVKPAQELKQEIELHAKAKKNKIPAAANRDDDAAPSCRNPSTRTGLSVTQEVIDQCRDVGKARDKKAEDTAAAKQRAEDARVEKRRQIDTVGRAFLRRVDAGAVAIDAKSLGEAFRGKAGDLKDVLAFLDEETSGTKAVQIPRLASALAKRPGPRPLRPRIEAPRTKKKRN